MTPNPQTSRPSRQKPTSRSPSPGPDLLEGTPPGEAASPAASLSEQELLDRLALLCCMESQPSAGSVVEALGGWGRAAAPKRWGTNWHSRLRVGQRTLQALHRHWKGEGQARRAAEAELRWLLGGENRRVLFRDGPDWPQKLERGPGSPVALFLHGRAELLQEPMIAVVGSRRQTTLGGQAANYFAAQLAQLRLGVVSGCAEGIDCTAHRAALENGGSTIGVLGTGLARRFPEVTRELQNRLTQDGLLVSEYLHAQDGRRHHFPARNRIIASLAEVVLVVEAGEKSGALGTARLAAEMGVEVMAVPGSIFSKASRGCHQLLREGALLAAEIEDLVVASGRLLAPKRGGKGDADAPRLHSEDAADPAHREILALLDGPAVPVDLLAESLGRPIAELVPLLGDMELRGLVRCEAGGYVRV